MLGSNRHKAAAATCFLLFLELDNVRIEAYSQCLCCSF